MHFCVSPITVWVVSKNESNCLSENKMVSTLNWRHVSLLSVVQSNILWLTILLSYHYRCNVVFTNYRFPVSFLLYIATQKKRNQIITVNSSTNTLITKKITLARFACLCSKFRKYLVFFSPYSIHLALLRMIAPFTFCSVIRFNRI